MGEIDSVLGDMGYGDFARTYAILGTGLASVTGVQSGYELSQGQDLWRGNSLTTGEKLWNTVDVGLSTAGVLGSVRGASMLLTAPRTAGSLDTIAEGYRLVPYYRVRSAIPIPEGHSRVFRAVSEAEYQQILMTRRFEVPPGRPGFSPMDGKWFADSIESATAHGNALQGPGHFRLIEADLPNNAPSLYRHPNIDGRGPGRYLDINDLNGVTPRLLR